MTAKVFIKKYGKLILGAILGILMTLGGSASSKKVKSKKVKKSLGKIKDAVDELKDLESDMETDQVEVNTREEINRESDEATEDRINKIAPNIVTKDDVKDWTTL